MANFVHLHTHSHYSLLDGLGKIPELVSRAKELGMKALALTDHGAMYGAIEFYQECLNQGIKPIIGVETYLAPRKMTDKQPKIDTNPYHLILLAKNNTGYQNLLYLVTQAHLVGHYYRPRIDKEILRKHSHGLIASTACFFGEIPQAILNKPWNKVIALAKEYQDIFGKENFYLELQDHPEIPEQTKINEGLKKLSGELKIPLICTADIHYVRPEDRDPHEILLAVQTGKDLDDETRMSLKETNLSMRPPEEMIKIFGQKVAANTVEIAARCQLKLEFGRPILPKFPLPGGQTPKSYLEKLAWEGLKKRYQEVSPELKKRLKFELEVIEKTHFEDYLLIVADYVNFAKTHGILVGPGRGSAAGSLTSFALNITDIDPIKYNLLFERFLNPERIAPPDIDLDFADNRRDEVLNYISQKYGQENVAQIITFGTMASRGSVRDTGRALGMSYTDVDKIAKLIPFGLSLAQALEAVDELKDLFNQDSQVKRLLEMAQRLEGVVRHASTHAAGIVISHDSLVTHVPLQYAPRGEQEIITQYAMNELETIGLIKMDILGLANLSIMDNCIRIVRKTRGVEVDIDNLPLEDQATYSLLSRAETTGVFQLECLSGNTFISNTTIKKLHERRDKKRLQSVYLDEGKVHKNKIIKTLKGDNKDLYALVAENGWHIKASKDHYFLTPSGWKKLGDMRPGDDVLIKEKAKHSIYNTCRICQRQIDGQKEGKSKFCYQCSATFYENPKKTMSRENLKKARIRFYKEGGKPWNYGLRLETNEILKKKGRKISMALSGRSLESLWGKEKAEKFKKAHSKRNKGTNNPMFGKSPPHRKGGFRIDLEHYVRSSWEADFARILRLHHLDYQYEPKTFTLQKDNKILTYTPDFYVPSQNTFYEIKGWLHSIDTEKINLFKEQYPQTNLVLISATKFAEFALKYKTLIKWECPQIPKGFRFIKVRKILKSEREQTFDIAMKAPGNNFIANGFLVHNSDGMKRYLKELKPSKFEDIIAMVALYRPGPMELIPDYIAGKHRRKKITYLHPDLEPILSDTYGIAVYQEQLLQIAREIAGFSLGEADILRKAVGKKIKKLLMEQELKFIQGAVKKGTSRQVAEKIFRFIEPFAEYGFNRAHATCYAKIAYQTAYLKAHFPQEYMAALMTSEQNNLDKLAVAIGECERMGLAVLPPDVNESFVDFGVVKDTTHIRFGLAAVKNVGVGVAEAIVEERKNHGPFKNLEDFLLRLGTSNLNKKVIEALAKAGALDAFAERNEILASIENILKFLSLMGKPLPSRQLGLFGSETIQAQGLGLVKIEAASKKQRLSWEKELLGMYVSEHPLKGMEETLIKFANPIGTVSEDAGARVKVVGIITNISKILTRSREPMIFATLEDTSAKTEVLVFPKVLKKDSLIWRVDNIVLVEGRTNTKDGALKIIAETAREIAVQQSLDKKISSKKITIILPDKSNKEILIKIKQILLAFPGQIPVYLKIPRNGQLKEIKTKTSVAPDSSMIKNLAAIVGRKNIVLEV